MFQLETLNLVNFSKLIVFCFLPVTELFESFKAKTEPAVDQAGSDQLLDLKAGLKRVSAHPQAPPPEGREAGQQIDFKANLKKVSNSSSRGATDRTADGSI